MAFSSPYSLIRTVVFGPSELEVNGPEDLVGKRVGVARGTTVEIDLDRTAPEGTEIVRFDDDATSVVALGAGQIDLLATGDHRFAVLNERFPGKFETKYDLNLFYLGLGMRRGDADWQHWVDTWVFLNHQNGTLGGIYKKWVGDDMPQIPSF
ncbi:MAG: transporter periplasmic substrate-binding protein [Devosia sp.]|nr:transporter periplasmic substrate-binding protein [Devosia sp.]